MLAGCNLQHGQNRGSIKWCEFDKKKKKKDHENEATMKQESHNSTCPEHTSQNMVSLVKRRKAWLKREAPINQERKKLNQDEKSDPHEVHHSLNLTS